MSQTGQAQEGFIGEDRMAAKILEGDWEDKFELKLETGKWLLTKIECDLGKLKY